MDPSFRIVPENPSKTASIRDTAGSLGLHDTFQHGQRNLAAENDRRNGIRQRLESWEETQDNLKLTMLRNTFGMHAPIRLLMERKIVGCDAYLPAKQKSNLHLDILMGRDEMIEPADIFGGLETGNQMDIHREMERKLRL